MDLIGNKESAERRKEKKRKGQVRSEI